jgi:hypothetical protein
VCFHSTPGSGAAGASRIPLGFTAGVAGALGVFVAGCLLVSSREWFAADDFPFLFHVQQVEPWSWLDIRTAFEAYWWPFYRPLGMESFYYANYRLFGLNFTAFVLAALFVNLVTGWLVYRIALGVCAVEGFRGHGCMHFLSGPPVLGRKQGLP